MISAWWLPAAFVAGAAFCFTMFAGPLCWLLFKVPPVPDRESRDYLGGTQLYELGPQMYEPKPPC